MSVNNTHRLSRPEGISSYSIGRIAGIEVFIHWTWLIIFLVLTWSLAEGLYLHDYPGWSAAQAWLAGAATSLVLFLCVLLHELSHSLLARSQGMGVTRITLFLFGGVSSLDQDAKDPAQEFAIAAIGPLTSLLLAAAFAVPAVLVGGAVGRAATYLAIINLALGVFNLLTGFPLDGGRVLRSIVWARTHNLLRATRFAASGGRYMGVLLAIIGLIEFLLTGDVFGGLWLGLIGWFLYSQAGASYQLAATTDTLSRIKVTSCLEQRYHAVDPDLSMDAFVSSFVLTFHERFYPVMSDGHMLGLISVSDLKRFDRSEWPDRKVSDSMMPIDRLVTVGPSDDLATATQLMGVADVHQLPVMQDEQLLGFVTRADVIQALNSRTALQSFLSDLGPEDHDESAVDADGENGVENEPLSIGTGQRSDKSR
jgi:Zn-dependent protease